MKRSRPPSPPRPSDEQSTIPLGRAAMNGHRHQPATLSQSDPAKYGARIKSVASGRNSCIFDANKPIGVQQQQQHQRQKQQPWWMESRLSPHTLRLLQLISGGSSSQEYVTQAIQELSQTAAQSDPQDIWDLLGRLQQCLIGTTTTSTTTTSASWSSLSTSQQQWESRTNAARALEEVARHLPRADQLQFLQKPNPGWQQQQKQQQPQSSQEQAPDDATMAVPIARTEPNADTSLYDDTNIDMRVMAPCDTRDDHYLTVSQVAQDLPRILEQGQPLWACAEGRYRHAEQDLLRALDADVLMRQQHEHSDVEGQDDVHQPISNRNQGDELEDDWLQQRIRLQRRIMAQRLGLAGIQQALEGSKRRGKLGTDGIESSHDVEIEDADWMPSTSSTWFLPQDATEAGQSQSVAMLSDSSSIRSLLLLEMHREGRRHDSTSAASCSHERPQTLLATEFIYRMMDPIWYVRHGAILGILSLLRAWKHVAQKQHREASRYSCFGAWPQDILARCVCVLALDRFGDFSGAVVLATTALTSATTTPAMVAPVREVAGQLVSVLVAMAPIDIQNKTFDLLFRLIRYRHTNVGCALAPSVADKVEIALLRGRNTCTQGHGVDWEIRHGALVALKYITIVETKGLLQDQRGEERVISSDSVDVAASRDAKPTSPHSSTRLLLDLGRWLEVARIAVDHLSDTGSDDVQSVAAQILIANLRGPGSFLANEVWSHGPCKLWKALTNASSFASCLIDLVGLLSEYLQQDAASFLCVLSGGQILQRNDDSVVDLVSVVRSVLSLLDSDFASVRSSVLRCTGIIGQALSNMLPQAEKLQRNAVGTKSVLVQAYCLLIEHLFALYQKDIASSGCSDESGASHDKVHTLANFRDQSWHQLTSVASSIIGSCPEEANMLIFSLIREFFFVRVHHQTGNPGWLFCFDDDTFARQVDAANALAWFLRAAHSSCDAVWENPLLEFSLRVFLKSQWTCQFESACFLFRALADRCRIHEETIPGYYDRLMESMLVRWAVPCVEASESLMHPTTAGLQLLCHEVFLQKARAILTGTDQVLEAVEAVVQFWVNALRSPHGQGISTNSGHPISSLISLRIGATLAGSALAATLPTKLTPYIRPLMTSFKNETGKSRLWQTCDDLTSLVARIRANPAFANAQAKILHAICESSFEVRNEDVELSPGVRCLERLAQFIANDSLENFPVIRDHIRPLQRESGTDQMERIKVLKAMHILCALCRGLPTGTSLTAFLSESFVPHLVLIVCGTKCEEVRQRGVAALRALCSADPGVVLHRAIPVLNSLLKESLDQSLRLGACWVLKGIVEIAGTFICPFVRVLLAPILSLMTDQNEECSRYANRIFAALVQAAPLARSESNAKVGSDETNKHQQSVIDHLILGEPLPLCDFPDDLAKEMKQSNLILRDYQLEGISWLRFLQTMNLNGALCDSMGLGKTVQALAGIALSHADKRGNSRPVSLIVCPSTVVGHWLDEIHRFFPGGKIFRPLGITGSAATRNALWEATLLEYNIIVISYHSLRSDIAFVSSRPWRYCVLDEGHLLKNPKTVTARASRKISACHKLVVTGTLVQNSVYELWATFDFLMPNFLGNSSSFTKDFANPITTSQLPGASPQAIAIGMAKLKALHQQVLPFILRREKEAVLKELPPKNITLIKAPMSEFQTRLYRMFCERPDVKEHLASFQCAIEQGLRSSTGKFSVSADTLKRMIVLRLICTHPALVISHRGEPVIDELQTYRSSGKLIALAELLRETGLYDDRMNAADFDSSLLYCQGDMDTKDAFTQVVKPHNDGTSALDFHHLNPRIRSRSKCLIFAQFAKSLDVVEELLLRRHLPFLKYLRVDGKVAPPKRNLLVEAFNRDASISLMLLTSRVGGLGINLTGADTVVFLECDYNPFSDIQAMDRAHRIGQKRTVNVYRLVAADSIEEKIIDIQDKKLALSESIISTDNSSIYSMGTSRLLDIFGHTGSSQGEEGNQNEDDLDRLIESIAEEYSCFSPEAFVRSFTDK